MEDKNKQYLTEIMALLKVSPNNPFIKDAKKLIKLKTDAVKAIYEAGLDLEIA